jgi:two-component system LytT family response regulator
VKESAIRVLLVDDEQLARDRLRRMLLAHPGLEVVGEAEDGEQAIAKIVESKPDLVFLDIQMPGCSGLEVAASLPSPRPKIIFCTAFDEYAVDAFELHAVDYLLKPVNRTRLAAAVERISEPGRQVDEPDAAIDRAGRESGQYPSRFLAKRGTRFYVVARDDVLCFASEEGLTTLLTAKHNLWMQPSLSDLEARLDPERFFRVSRSAIVNLDAVDEVLPGVGGQGEVQLSNGLQLEVSRRRFKALMARLGDS